MRDKLKVYRETRGTFTGTFVRMGTKTGWHMPEPTILFSDIKDTDGNILTDHLWFNYTKGFKKAGPYKEGDVVQFDARCQPYEKGYKGYREDVYCPISMDYKLSFPTKIKKIGGKESS